MIGLNKDGKGKAKFLLNQLKNATAKEKKYRNINLKK